MEDKQEQPLRIAQVIGKMMSGGVELAVMNYYRHIDKSKVQFDFIIDEDSTIVPYDEIESLGGRVYKIPPYHKPIAYHKALTKLLRENDYRIVHSHINSLSVFPLFAAKRAGVPIRIAHSHSTAGKGETLRNIIKYSLRSFSRIFPTHFFACSEHAGRWLFGDKLFDTGKVTLVKYGIDLTNFKPNSEARVAVRKELKIDDKLVVANVGRFMKQKNHSQLLDIFVQVHNINPDSVLLLIGEGELEQEIRDKANKLNLSDCVLFMGVRHDVHRLMQGMDVFLFPSIYEGLGIVVLEAQAVGLRVVASDKVPKEVKVASDNVMFVSLAQSPQKWAEAVLATGTDDGTRSMGFEAVAEAGYEIGTAAEKLCGYYCD